MRLTAESKHVMDLRADHRSYLHLWARVGGHELKGQGGQLWLRGTEVIS